MDFFLLVGKEFYSPLAFFQDLSFISAFLDFEYSIFRFGFGLICFICIYPAWYSPSFLDLWLGIRHWLGEILSHFLKYFFCSFLLLLALHHTHIMPFVLVPQFWNVLSRFYSLFFSFFSFLRFLFRYLQAQNIQKSTKSSKTLLISVIVFLFSGTSFWFFLRVYISLYVLPIVLACFLLYFLRILIIAAFSSQYNILAILESGFWCLLCLFRLGFLPLSMPCNFTK